MKKNKLKIGVVGLGYVGLPVAMALSKFHDLIGFDTNEERIEGLKNFEDLNLEFSKDELSRCNINFTNNSKTLSLVNVFIITVPTPVKQNKKPDLSYLEKANKLVSRYLKKDDLVIYESTVYPGCTEEFSVPILEKSGFKLNKDFLVGYSPERINPGDKINNLQNIIKVVSGSNEKALKKVEKLYKEIITAGVHKAKSIKTAEAAKVIENTQRDINIALMNECSIIFNKLNIDTKDVLEAASTKWNFLNFEPGLVGGHCIGVDPFYLTYAGEKVGYKSKVILSGRSVNDNMGLIVSKRLQEVFSEKLYPNKKSLKVLVLGKTFKENCPDVRNSLVPVMINEFKKFCKIVHSFDPYVDLRIDLREFIYDKEIEKYDALVIAVAHKKFKQLTNLDILKLVKSKAVVFDLKSILNKEKLENSGLTILRL